MLSQNVRKTQYRKKPYRFMMPNSGLTSMLLVAGSCLFLADALKPGHDTECDSQITASDDEPIRLPIWYLDSYVVPRVQLSVRCCANAVQTCGGVDYLHGNYRGVGNTPIPQNLPGRRPIRGAKPLPLRQDRGCSSSIRFVGCSMDRLVFRHFSKFRLTCPIRIGTTNQPSVVRRTASVAL